MAGFQGVNPLTKEVTTLGRGGSDTTAVAMASALQADRCEIIKEVAGVCSADPRVVPNSVHLPQLDFGSLAEMCFWGAKVLHFRSVELARSKNVPLLIKKWDHDRINTCVTNEVTGMEYGKILAVNTLTRVEHIEIDAANLNEGFANLARHLEHHLLAWPQLLASAYSEGKCRIALSSDGETLDTLLRTLEKSTGLRQQRAPLSSVTVTCYGGVSSDLPHRALQILTAHGIIADKYILSPHSLSLFVQPEQRDAALRALHTLVAV